MKYLSKLKRKKHPKLVKRIIHENCCVWEGRTVAVIDEAAFTRRGQQRGVREGKTVAVLDGAAFARGRERTTKIDNTWTSSTHVGWETMETTHRYEGRRRMQWQVTQMRWRELKDAGEGTETINGGRNFGKE
ncbi:hypothetical protein HN51_068534 [Arachis hypogaea]